MQRQVIRLSSVRQTAKGRRRGKNPKSVLLRNVHNHGIVEEVRKALNAEIGGTTAVSYYPSHSVPSLCRQLLLSLQQAIYKMSGMPAAKLGLTDRGILAEGKKADILVIDLEQLHDNATYKEDKAVCDGIECVMVNGQIAVEDAKVLPVFAGRVLRKGRE